MTESKQDWVRRQIQKVSEQQRLSYGWDIPRDKSYSDDAIQCDDCGGFGCPSCYNSGWVAPNSPHARRCHLDGCEHPIPPFQVAVYCSNECALLDA